MRSGGRDIDDNLCAALRLKEQRQARARDLVRPAHVHLPRRPPLLRVAVRDPLVALREARVVHEHIQPAAERAAHGSRARAHRRRVRHVHHHLEHLRRLRTVCGGGGRVQLAFERVEVGGRARRDRDSRGARSGERERRGAADAPARAGDEDGPAREVALGRVDGRVRVVVGRLREVDHFTGVRSSKSQYTKPRSK